MKKLIQIVAFLAATTFFNQVFAQTGNLTIRVVRVQMIGGDGADNCDDSGSGCGFEHRVNVQTRINGGAYSGPGCQYYDNDNDFNPNLLVATYSNIAPPTSGDVNLVTYHEDDSLVGNCTYNGSDDNGCAGPVSMTTQINNAVALNGTPYYTGITCTPTGVYIELEILWAEIVNGGTTCADAQPICNSSAFAFNLGTNSVGQANLSNGDSHDEVSACGNWDQTHYSEPVTGYNVGCLGQGDGIPSTAGAVWWYIKIAPGSGSNLSFNLNAASDVDFVLYGPYKDLASISNLCGRHRAVTDCGYHGGSTTEVIDADDVAVGDFYLLYVLNYAGVDQTATLSPTGTNTAIMDCSLVAACVIKKVSYVSQTACTGADIYTATVKVEFDLPVGTVFPTNIVVNGQTFSVTAADNTAGFKNVTLTNLPANSLPVSVNAYFESTPSCAGGLANAWTAPAPCDPCPAKAGNW